MKLILAGGFLGSGKTTAIINGCLQLKREGRRVAVITNDQGEQQVDSAYINSHSIPLREVANGCFCCNYNQLDEHVQSLFEAEQPELVFAESVGSCTDLVATIAKPFARFRPKIEVVISVFTDAFLLMQLLEGNASFIKENIRYIFKKQLEEADILVLNKVDLITADQQAYIDRIIYAEYPGKIILHQNSLDLKDINNWLQAVIQFQNDSERKTLDIDYDIYGDGEAQLAWLDKIVYIYTESQNAIHVAERIARDIYAVIQQEQLMIVHLKFFLESDSWKKKWSATLTGNDFDDHPEIQPSNYCSLLINARIQTEPAQLQKLVVRVLEKITEDLSVKIVIEKSSSFKPGYPRPNASLCGLGKYYFLGQTCFFTRNNHLFYRNLSIKNFQRRLA